MLASPLNARSYRLYERFAVAYVGERKRYYRDNGEDALLMTVAPLDAGYQARLAA